jgi:hypothetical protein
MAQPQRPRQQTSSPATTYEQRCTRFGQQCDIYNRRSYRNANISLALFVAALVWAGGWLWSGALLLLASAALFGVAFVVSFIHHGRVDQVLRRYTELFAINEEGLRRLQRDWAALPLRQPPDADQQERTKRAGFAQAFAPFIPAVLSPAAVVQKAREQAAAQPSFVADLDLFGHASLQHLLNTPATPVGLALLRDWLLVPAPHAVARKRQPAVAELAPLVEFRDDLALRGRLMGAAQPNYERFLRWAEAQPWLARRGWLLWLARVIPLITLGLAAAQVFELTSYPLWLAGIAAGLVLTQTIGRSVDGLIDEVAARQAVFATYAELFRLVEAQPFEAPILRELQGDLAAGGLRADQQMQRLGRLMALADLRGWMFFFPIQLATLWNVHVLWLLERWQRDAGGSARRWLLTLGAVEALAALATLVHDNPSWAFPDLYDLGSDTTGSREVLGDPDLRGSSDDAADAVIQARNLGHPLLPPDVCVGNDIAIGPRGTFLLVTGSNMSGKSTLLRAIGVNIVLAQAGGPVCAAALRLPPLALATSMRVQDSLEQGVSYFMAELQRLKEVVDAAERVRSAGERTLLFLLDEILHGTNTTERQIAARQIILHLLSMGAAGVVSTHDLTLADAPELSAVSRLVHFTEQFARGADGLRMTFDYTLRSGIATSTNALHLMEMLGLPTTDSQIS